MSICRLKRPLTTCTEAIAPGANLFSDSLMCVDIETGKVVWYRQLIHHDIWDYDMPPHPILVDINVDGRPIKAVVQLTKQAFAYVFDRVTGAAGLADRGTAGSGVGCSRRAGVPDAAVSDEASGVRRPGNHDKRSDRFHAGAAGESDRGDQAVPDRPLYTPGSLGQAPGGTRGTIILPGFGGGANWESGAADPETGFVYVGSNTGPSVIALTRPQPNTQTAELYQRRRSRSAPDRRLASDEAAVWPHHRVRHEQGRNRLADRRMATRRPPSRTIPPLRD